MKKCKKSLTSRISTVAFVIICAFALVSPYDVHPSEAPEYGGCATWTDYDGQVSNLCYPRQILCGPCGRLIYRCEPGNSGGCQATWQQFCYEVCCCV